MAELTPEQEAALANLRRRQRELDPPLPSWPETPEQKRQRLEREAGEMKEIGCLLTQLVWIGIPLLLFLALIVTMIWSMVSGD